MSALPEHEAIRLSSIHAEAIRDRDPLASSVVHDAEALFLAVKSARAAGCAAIDVIAGALIAAHRHGAAYQAESAAIAARVETEGKRAAYARILKTALAELEKS